MKGKKLDENDYKKIIQLKNDGRTNPELANLFGVTSSRIGQILRQYGISSVNSRYLNFSQEDCQKIISLYNGGVSATKIAESFGCSRKPIVEILHKNGIKLDTTLRKVSKDDYHEIINMYGDGMTQREIADVYGCSTSVIHNIMKKIGLQARPNGLTKECAEQMYALYSTEMRLPQIAELYGVSRHTVGRVFKRNGFESDRKTYHCDESFFDIINTPDKAYILGLLWADGCNQLNRGTVTLQLQERDQHILEQIKLISCNERPLLKTELNKKNPNWQNAITLTWQSHHISQQLNGYGMVPRKSLVVEFPCWIDNSLYSHFIRGYMDGDGSIYYSQDKKVFRVSMVGTKMFLDVVRDICSELGIKTSLSHKTEHNDITYTLYITSNSGSICFANWIYEDANLKLQRKYTKYQQALIDYNINNSLLS